MLLGTVTSEKFDEKGNSYWDCWTTSCASVSSVGISSGSSVVVAEWFRGLESCFMYH